MENGEGIVEEGKRRCKSLKARIETLTSTPSSAKTTLLRLINSEVSFLNRLSLSNNDDSPLKHSFNIGYLESIAHILQHPLITAVSRVCKPISKIHVDIICSFNGNPVWFIVSDRNPRYISWEDSEKTRNNKGLRTRIVKLLAAASESLITVRPRSVIFFFSNGVSSCIIERLRDEFGATDFGFGFGFSDFDCEFCDELEDGDWVNVLGRSFEKASVLEIEISSFCSSNDVISDSSGNVNLRGKMGQTLMHIKDASYDVKLGDSFLALVSALRSRSSFDDEEDELVNFDTTALVAIVSGISNGGIDRILATPESELRSRFKGNYEFMVGQVNSELNKPIHMELIPVISQKRGIVCESVCSEFQELVSVCGGHNEKSRTKHFLEHLRVVPDCPSKRLMSLPTTRKLALKNKVVFGTGDYWHAPTITANVAFVRAVSQTGMSLFTIEHRPRALVGD